MKKISEIRRENVKKLMAMHGLSRTEFSEKVDIAYSQVSQYIGENPTKNIGNSVAERIEVAFNLSKNWLDQDWSTMQTGNGMVFNGSNINNGTQIGQQHIRQNVSVEDRAQLDEQSSNYLKDMPLLDIDAGVQFSLDPTSINNLILDNNQKVATFIPHSERTFAIKNNTDIIGITPSTIRTNDILIIEPFIAPRSDDLILLCLDYQGENRGVIARLFVDLLGNRTIKHDENPPVPIPPNSLICGVVVEIKRRLLETSLVKARLNREWNILTTLQIPPLQSEP